MYKQAIMPMQRLVSAFFPSQKNVQSKAFCFIRFIDFDGICCEFVFVLL